DGAVAGVVIHIHGCNHPPRRYGCLALFGRLSRPRIVRISCPVRSSELRQLQQLRLVDRPSWVCTSASACVVSRSSGTSRGGRRTLSMAKLLIVDQDECKRYFNLFQEQK